MPVQQGKTQMTLLLTTMTMMAFAAVYAAVLAMLGNRGGDLAAALLGRPLRRVQAVGGVDGAAGDTSGAVSRRFSLA